MPQVGSTYTPYFAPGPIMPTLMGPDPSGVASQLSVVPQTVVAQQKMPRSDRLEVCAPTITPNHSLSTEYHQDLFNYYFHLFNNNPELLNNNVHLG